MEKGIWIESIFTSRLPELSSPVLMGVVGFSAVSRR